MKVAALIVAAGRGTRLGSEIPKQYIPINGACALRRSVDRFLEVEEISCVIVVIHADDVSLYQKVMDGVNDARLLPWAEGSDTRAASVMAGLGALRGHGASKVLIHDAARPFVPCGVIKSIINALDNADGACAALPVVDALWQGNGVQAENPLDRTGVWRAQTPQGFWFDAILTAHHHHDGTGADDVAVAREAGLSVVFVEGDEASYKITTQRDLERALRETA